MTSRERRNLRRLADRDHAAATETLRGMIARRSARAEHLRHSEDDYRDAAPMIGPDGEAVTKRTRLDDRGDVRHGWHLGAGSGNGGAYVKRHSAPTLGNENIDARGIGAVTVKSTRMGDRARSKAIRSAPRTWETVRTAA